ncbi:DNA cytosine methyltransferase [Streptomyces sp. 7N604]|uniref:DNA cytosine methyltransferase n=1 Tax=Streptomyces sp. 7N604 TaxID=3457415 RepID=UPI003FD16173
MTRTESKFTSVEICAGAGGQAVGLHEAGFRHLALIEIDDNACKTLELNKEKRGWDDCRVLKRDLTQLNPRTLGLKRGELDLLAGGVPCPPFSVAGKQLGPDDDRDLFPTMLDLVDFLEPRAVMIENVRGLLEPPQKFHDYRENVIKRRLMEAGYEICMWEVLEACDYGVPQLRPRAILVAMRPEFAKHYEAPNPENSKMRTVGEVLRTSMRKRFKDDGSDGWEAAYRKWYRQAKQGIAPTLVGGSKKHGGADLGPSRAKEAWKALGVNGLGVANDPRDCDRGRDLYSDRGPMLTVEQAALIQGFPANWKFAGRKTAAYRQVGNAFPPPVAKAVGIQIKQALEAGLKARPEAAQEEVLFDLVPGPSAPLRAELADCGSDLERASVG